MTSKVGIPATWTMTNVEAVSEAILSGSGFPKEFQGDTDGDYPFAKVGDISQVFRAGRKVINSAGNYISEQIRKKINARAFPPGTIVFPKIGEAPRNNYRVINSVEMIFDNNVMGIVPKNELVDKDYLYYYLTTRDFGELAVATAVPSIRKGDVGSIAFPLAPLNEQRRIVSKIEELFSDLDEGEAALRRVQSLLASYRQAVLKAAVTGELTKAWRETNQHRLESGEALLQRILQARREQWNGRGQYQEPQPPDIDELPDLPEGWVWASIDQLFNVYVGSTPSRKEPSYWGGDIPWVSSGEVAFCRISDTKEKITRQGYENSSVKLHPKGTVLLAMIGEGRTRGQAAILDIEACHNQNSASIRVSETDIPPGYIYYLLMYSYEQNRRMGQGGNQPALNGMKIKGLTVPLAPLEEMKEIVNQIEIISSRIDALEIWCKTELARSATLRQSILKAAFSGKLVLQDPGDEPASVLLERIQAARPSPSPSKPTSRTGAKTQPKVQPTLWESS
ncbi:MAG: type I restriction endonuclease subunit S [Chloroflexi bacterium]|nr:MAG: type I restriction endonuclease subunit S [Chloroflexota bacterium]